MILIIRVSLINQNNEKNQFDFQNEFVLMKQVKDQKITQNLEEKYVLFYQIFST